MSKLIHRLAAAMAASLLGALGAGPAGALGISPNPIILAPDASNQDPGYSGVLTLVDVVSGIPAGGSVLAGSVAGSDVTLVFQASLDASATPGALGLLVLHPESLDSAYTGVRYTGAGTIAGGGQNVTSASLGGSYVTLSFGAPGLAAGDSSDLVFVSIGALSAGTPFAAALTTVGDFAEGTALVVPEPAAAALLQFGLVLVGVSGLGGRTRRA